MTAPQTAVLHVTMAWGGGAFPRLLWGTAPSKPSPTVKGQWSTQ